MSRFDLSLFETEKELLQEAKDLIKGEQADQKALLSKFSDVVEQFDKLIRDSEKIIKISDGQQEYLHKIQKDLEKQIEERIRAEEKLKYLAAIDSLTGTYNRGMGLSLLEQKIKSIRRNRGTFSICYIDVNGLKYVNDSFGHSEGDELLVLICRFITEGIRESDILCRLGGDEFIILFTNSKKENAEKVISRIISNLHKENERKLRPYDISFSHGIVQVDYEKNWSIDEIIQMADEKMYLCKEQYKKLTVF